jgi:hypothetical protein
MKKFLLKKLNKVEREDGCLVEISKSVVALDNLVNDVVINRAWQLLERISEFQPKRFWVITN